MERITRVFVFLLVVLIPKLLLAQFGNEWIDYNQQYFKIKVVEDDFYRVTRAELEAAGFPIATINSNRIQLFRDGNEVAIDVEAPNGNFEYFDFYGRGIDGTSDADLYEVGDQPHEFYNLFSDTATYFLTYKLNNQNGLRMDFSTDGDISGLTPLTHHLEEDLQVYTNNYADGLRFGSQSAFTESKYDLGEGWTGDFKTKNGFTNHDFVLENRISGSQVICEFGLTGGNSQQHNSTFLTGPDGTNLVENSDIQFTGWGSIQGAFAIESNRIGTDGSLTIQTLREGLPDVAERFAVSFMRLEYEQEISVIDGTNKVFTLPDLSSSRAYLRVSTTNPSAFSAFDISDEFTPIRIATANGFTDRFDLVIPNAVSGHKVLVVSNPASVESIEPATLNEPEIAGKNYIIITHQNLRAGSDPVSDYATYRESVEGGDHSVEIVLVDELYDQFNYGDPSPLAIRRFIQFTSNATSLDYVFLIGKGYTVDNNLFRDSQFEEVNIPPFGKPGSDLMYTLGINSNTVVPGVPIGRLNAFDTDDVTAYLNKVIEMEAVPFDDLWRKDFLQLSGGNNSSELTNFAGYIEEFSEVLVEDFIGGRALNTGKETREAVEFINVTDTINKGVGYVTFFGHSGGNSTDIEIGRVSNSSFGWSNKGKYPIFLINGCNAGDIFGDNFTFGEDWMITPDLGSIAFMAHSSTAGANTLRRWSNIYYATAFGDELFIGETLGNVIIEVSKTYADQNGTSRSSLTQLQQMLLQGDPALRVFGADNPDYELDPINILARATEGNEILATQESFEVSVVIKNHGRSVADSTFVQLERELSNGSKLDYFLKVPRILRQDTITFVIPNEPSNTNTGLNTLTVTVDALNETEELNETNNVASISLTIFNGSTSHLQPLDNGITSSNAIDLVWQSSNLIEEERSYDIEIDTRATFDSPSKQSFVVTTELIGQQSVDLDIFNSADSTTYYWRTRFTDPAPDESSEWVVSAFTVIDGVESGWGIYDSGQLESQDIRGVSLSASSNDWEFIQSSIPVEIFTFGADSDLMYEDLRAVVAGIDFMVTSTDEVCHLDRLNAIAFDKESSDPYRPIDTGVIDISNDEVCGRLPQRIYNFSETALLGTGRRLQVLIDNMRDGDQIMIYSIGDLTYSNWDSELIATLNSVGISSSTISSLVDGQPVIFYGQKGSVAGTAIEIVSDGTSIPLREQSLLIQDVANGSFTSGSFQSNRIGPAKDWSSYSFNIDEELNDNYSLDVFGIATDGTRVNLNEFQRGRAETIDVSAIDALAYPSLELEFSFEDETDLTPPQLNFWQLDYELPPDGILILEEKEVASFQEGQVIERSFGFYNYSGVDFTDSLDVVVRLINPASSEVQENTFKILGPLSGDTTSFNTSFSSLDFIGSNSLSIVVTPNENEAYDFNNQLFFSNIIEVDGDAVNPVLDVTFDGIRILDGDVVSPTPSISVRVRDTNPFLFKSDTTGINVSLRLPGETSQFQRINFSSPELSFATSSESEDFEVTYEPGALENGVYGLRVQAQDESGNNAGTEPYEVNFEVINESTITHFYPYPNPFSTSCRFVFTLTGTEIPDEIKIQILTVSGRVVREITQDEIGPIRAGNNITEYAWDGRDEFGDQLANGVYFYKVFVNSGGQALNQRATVADKAFKNGFGKLYILR